MPKGGLKGRAAPLPYLPLAFTMVDTPHSIPFTICADSVPKGGPKGPGRQFIEDTYLQRKRRRERYK